MIISDHRLPDVLGIQFIIEIRKQFRACHCAIVSGCLTDQDVQVLEEHQIPYFRKPLLYAKVIDAIRKKPGASTPVYVEPEPEPESQAVQEPESTEPENVTGKEKKLFGFWPPRKTG